jgi:putative phosphoesterase
MKLLILSDIHGSFKALEKTLEAYGKENCSMIVLLGDVLFHEPQNSISRSPEIKKTIELLNSVSDKILAVRGNCDREVDQTVLHFPIMNEYRILFDGNRQLFLTHGHLFNKYNMPSLNKGDIFACGHSHVAQIIERQGIIHFNPGSISMPRENTLSSYGLYDGENLLVKSLDGDLQISHQL